MGTVRKKKITVGQKIKDALMSQKKLARLTGINEVRLSRGINDELEFTPEEKMEIGKVLGITLN